MQITHISTIVNGQLVNATDDAVIRHLLIDSRNIFSGEETLFIAVKGERHNGHDYIEQVYQKGIRNFILSEQPKPSIDLSEANIVMVEDTVSALQQLAAYHRSQFNIPIIGITGSNGKTIIKEWLWQLLGEDKNVVRSPKSYNSQVGVPLSVWQLNEKHDIGVFEAGISMPGEMSKLENIIRPTIGIITNVKEAHIENFKNKAQIVSEKMQLFEAAKVLIYCCDYQEINDEVEQNPTFGKLEKLTWSFEGKADLEIRSVTNEQKGSKITAVYKEKELDLIIPFKDDASLENAIHCWLTMLYLEYDQDMIASRMQELTSITMRLEVKRGINNCILVNDSYNSDLASLNVALDFLIQQNPGNSKTLILSDIYQSGKNDQQLYESIARLIEVKKINRLIGIGERITAAAKSFQLTKHFYKDTIEFLNSFHEGQFQNESILVKGARNFKLERVSERLQEKAHETVLEVNLNALIGNFNYFKSLLNPATKLMVMVKATSYGVGSYEVARALQHNRVDYLGVAYADEGIHLRDGGITLPIMVMSPEVAAFDAMIRYELEPELYNFRTLNLFLETLKLNDYYLTNQQPFPIHLKLETGMHRLGFEETELDQLISLLQKSKDLLIVKSVFSHLSSSDEPSLDENTSNQVTLFKAMSEKIIDSLGYHIDRHILNTHGILRFPEAQFDMVRLGIGLYGIVQEPVHQSKLKPVTRLKTVISQIRKVKKGAKVGYNQQHEMQQDGEIATIPIGYADGLNRKLGNGRWQVLIGKHRVPIVGNVCMDMCMLDVTGVPVEEGDPVIIFDSSEDFQKISSILGTIPYEVFTSISGRVKRIFYDE